LSGGQCLAEDDHQDVTGGGDAKQCDRHRAVSRKEGDTRALGDEPWDILCRHLSRFQIQWLRSVLVAYQRPIGVA